MRRIVGVLVLCLTLVWAVQAQEAKYDGYQVWRITVRTPAELEQIQQLVRDVWMVRGSIVDVCLSPDEQATLRKAGFTGEVLIPDVGALIRQQKSDFIPQDGSLFTRYLTLVGSGLNHENHSLRGGSSCDRDLNSCSTLHNKSPHRSPRHANTNTNPDYTNTWSSDTDSYSSHTNTDPRTC
jgi:hypothetical protein